MSTASLPITPIAHRITDVAAMLRVSRSAAYRLVESGELRAVRIGKRSRRVMDVDLRAYLGGLRHEPPR